MKREFNDTTSKCQIGHTKKAPARPTKKAKADESSEISSLSSLARAALIKKGLFKIEYPPNTTTAYQSTALRNIELLIIQSQANLLQAVVDEHDEKINEILEHNPELLMTPMDECPVVESQLTWQTFHPELPLVMALVRDQVEISKRLFHYFDQLENGAKERERQWCVAESIKAKQKKNTENLIKQLPKLIEIIAKETFSEEKWINMMTKISPKIDKALEEFRQTLHPNKIIRLDEYYNALQLLTAAYEVYDEQFHKFKGPGESNQRKIFCVKVIGFIQSLLPPEYGKIFCQGLYDVVKDRPRTGGIYFPVNEVLPLTFPTSRKIVTQRLYDEVEGRQKMAERAKSLKLLGGESFYRPSRLSRAALGYEYFVGSRCVNPAPLGFPFPRETHTDYCLPSFKKLCSAKASELERLKKQLSIQSEITTASLNC